MAFPEATRDGDHGFLHQYPAYPAFSSNRPFKKHISPLEILSEATEETDAGFVSEDTEYSLCTSPTCTKESSSDEEAKLLVQPFGSSESPPLHGHGARGTADNVGGSNIQQISQSSATKAVVEKARSKVSFQEKAERSSTQMHRQMVDFSATKASARHPASSGNKVNYGKPRVVAGLQPPPQFVSPHVGALSSDRLMSSRAADFLHKHWTHALLKLRGFVCHQQQEGDASEEDGGLVQCQRRLPDTGMDDVNEMKALLNTINQNLKMLETKSKAHPQLLSSKLAPVYFTT